MEFIELNVNTDKTTKNVKHEKLNIYCDCFLEYTNFKNDLIGCKCFSCNKSYQRKLDEKLNEQFFKTYKFSNDDYNNR